MTKKNVPNLWCGHSMKIQLRKKKKYINKTMLDLGARMKSSISSVLQPSSLLCICHAYVMLHTDWGFKKEKEGKASKLYPATILPYKYYEGLEGNSSWGRNAGHSSLSMTGKKKKIPFLQTSSWIQAGAYLVPWKSLPHVTQGMRAWSDSFCIICMASQSQSHISTIQKLNWEAGRSLLTAQRGT